MVIQDTHNLAEEGKKGSMVVERGRPTKNAETRAETIRSKEGIENEK
jgi:hypothetical protein